MQEDAKKNNLAETFSPRSILEVKKADLKGDGVFTTENIKKDDIVLIGIVDKEMKVNDSHATQMGTNRFVLFDKINRTINHSCSPNCGIRVNPVTGSFDFVAIRDIAKGEEIVYDYSMRNFSIEHFPPECQCKSPNCRVRITGWKDLPVDRKMIYQHYASPYILTLDKDFKG